MTTANAASTQGPPVSLDPSAVELPRIDLPRPLSGAQVRSFVSEGYLVVRDAIARDERDALIADIVKILRGGYACPNIPPPPAPGLSDDELMRGYLGILQQHAISPVMLAFLKHPRICGMLSQLVGAHIPYWDGSVKAMQSMFFTKPPGYPGQAWHQDEIYIPTRDRSLCGAWVALDDATVENGCLYVLPRSHRMGYLYPQRPHTREGEWDFAPESYGFDPAAQAPVEVRACDAFFFHGYLLHCSYRNQSGVYRRAVVNHYCNAWSHLPWTLKEGESVGMADRRKIIPVAGVDPYAWKGCEEPSPQDVWVRPLKQREAGR